MKFNRILFVFAVFSMTFHAVTIQAAVAPSVSVSGNRLVDQNGKTVFLRGFNRPGSDYQCERFGIWDGPTDDDTSLNAMQSWGAAVHAVRVPLNEDCWLAVNVVPP